MVLSLFNDYPDERCYVAFNIIILFYASSKKHYYVAFMILSLIYPSPKKHFYITLILTHGSIFSTESLHYIFLEA